VSIVIPCYKQAQYLARTVHSVFEQKTNNVEVVIVNDGSPDNCDEVVKSIQQEFPSRPIKYVKQENQGLPGARNTGFRNASSPLVFTLDSDDCLLPDTLELCIREIERGADIAYVDLKKRSGAFDSMNFNAQEMKNRNTVAACALIKQEAWKKVGGYKLEMKEGCEDWEFWINCIEQGMTFAKANGAAVLVDDTHDGRMSPHIQQGEVYRRIRALVEQLHPSFYGHRQPPKTKVSVIISSYNQLQALQFALESLYLQVEPPHEVIVTDDGSSDGTIDWLDSVADKYPFPLNYVTRQHGGYRLASLQNLGARKATGDRFLFTNADVVHCPTSIRGHAILANDTVGAGIIKSISEEGTAKVTASCVLNYSLLKKLAEEHPHNRTNISYGKYDLNSNPIAVWGGNFSVSSVAFRKSGGFDEGFDIGWGGEDASLAKRCKEKAGCTIVWVDQSVVYHLGHPWKAYNHQQKETTRYATMAG
jgi:glycosyltransferase involved in cell wall biosynthesis